MQQLSSLRPSDEAIDTEFTPRRQQAVYQKVLTDAARLAPLPARRRRLPAVAAVAAVALTISSAGIYAATLDSGEPVTEPLPFNASPAAIPTASERVATEPDIASMSRIATGIVVSPIVLAEVAKAAEASPPAHTGRFLHTVTVSEQLDSHGSDLARHDAYIDADGWMWRHTTHEFNGVENSSWLLVPLGEDWVESLPTDPEALELQLRAGTGSNSEDERVFKNVHEILLTEIASPELRSAAITVLQSMAENPQDPAPAKEGLVASPQVTVYEVQLPNGGTGYRASIIDPTSRPGVENTLVLNAGGQLVESGSTYPAELGADSSSASSAVHFRSTVVIREWVDQLPAEFVDVLGTERVQREIDQ